jgi:hypothetical protein
MRIVYIAGSGRSGSTLLARILGQLEGFVSPGEVRHIWQTGVPLLAHDQLCGCGQPYDRCPLWIPVVEEVFGRISEDDLRELRSLALSVDRVRYIPWMIGMPGPRRYQKRLAEYRLLLDKLYRSVVHHSGARVLIDASKDPSTLFLLATLAEVRVTVVHLVRDVRGVTYSWRKKKLRPEFVGRRVYMQQHSVTKTAGFWLYGNLLCELSARHLDGYVRLRYEDFVRQPVESVRAICSAVGNDRPDLGYLSQDSCRLQRESHIISGNPNRFSSPEIRFRIDEEWKTKMKRSERLTAAFCGLPLLMRYGYLGNRKGDSGTT